MSSIPNCLNYCGDFIVYTQFTNVAARRIVRTWWAVVWTAILQRVKKKLYSRIGLFAVGA